MRHVFTPRISTLKITSRRTDSKLMFSHTKLDITCLQHLNHVVVSHVLCPKIDNVFNSSDFPNCKAFAAYLSLHPQCGRLRVSDLACATALPDAACCRCVCVDSQTHVATDIPSPNSLIKSPHNSFSEFLKFSFANTWRNSTLCRRWASQQVSSVGEIHRTRALSLKFVSSTVAVSVDVESANALLHPKHLH